jgi:hypothetical protein
MATLIEGNDVRETTGMTVLATERVVIEIVRFDNTVDQVLFDHNVPVGKQLNGNVEWTGQLIPNP